jgi:hypothetical protein
MQVRLTFSSVRLVSLPEKPGKMPAKVITIVHAYLKASPLG